MQLEGLNIFVSLTSNLGVNELEDRIAATLEDNGLVKTNPYVIDDKRGVFFKQKNPTICDLVPVYSGFTEFGFGNAQNAIGSVVVYDRNKERVEKIKAELIDLIKDYNANSNGNGKVRVIAIDGALVKKDNFSKI